MIYIYTRFTPYYIIHITCKFSTRKNELLPESDQKLARVLNSSAVGVLKRETLCSKVCTK